MAYWGSVEAFEFAGMVSPMGWPWSGRIAVKVWVLSQIRTSHSMMTSRSELSSGEHWVAPASSMKKSRLRFDPSVTAMT